MRPCFPSELLWFKEVDLLLVCTVRLYEWLETMAIDFEGLIACGIEYFHHSVGMHFMNYERTRPPGFQFSWKEMKFRIIKQNSLSLGQILLIYQLIMLFFQSCFGNF